MRLRWQVLLLAVGLLFVVGVSYAPQHNALAQGGGSCRALVARVYRALDILCSDMGRNEGCAAYPLVLTQGELLSETVQPGETFDLESLFTLQAGERNAPADEWGALAISGGAGLPANTPEYVTMWLLGEAELHDSRTEEQRDAEPAATCYANIITDELNIRSYPGITGRIIDVLHPDERFIITGRLADTSWLRIDYPDSRQTAWVFSGYVQTDCQVFEIPSVLPDAPPLPPEDWYRDPFQNATLETHPQPDACPLTPPPGMLLQTPDRELARFTLNTMTLELEGATLYTQADRQQGLFFQALDGTVRLTTPDNETIKVVPGTQLHFTLEEDPAAVTGPPDLEPLAIQELENIPLNRLPHPLERLPDPGIELSSAVAHEVSGDLSPGQPVTLFLDNQAGIRYDIDLTSDAFPVLTIEAPDTPIVRPLISRGHLRMTYWPTSDLPHLFTLEAGSTRSGTYQLNVQTLDMRLCRPGGNRQSRTLIGGESHAGNIWFGHAGETVILTASGDISHSASSLPDWRFRIAEMYQQAPTQEPVVARILEGHNANTITWEVPHTGYYWIEVWTAASGTTTVESTCP